MLSIPHSDCVRQLVKLRLESYVTFTLIVQVQVLVSLNGPATVAVYCKQGYVV